MEMNKQILFSSLEVSHLHRGERTLEQVFIFSFVLFRFERKRYPKVGAKKEFEVFILLRLFEKKLQNFLNFYTQFLRLLSFTIITKYWLYSPCCIIHLSSHTGCP